MIVLHSLVNYGHYHIRLSGGEPPCIGYIYIGPTPCGSNYTSVIVIMPLGCKLRVIEITEVCLGRTEQMSQDMSDSQRPI